MNKRTRYFVVGSAAIVIVGLCTGLVAFYNGGLPMLSTAQGPTELSYVPANATAVAFANVREVMNSDFRQKISAAMPTGEGRDEFLKETGIDIERDIDTVVAGVSTDQKAGVVLIRGRFNDGQIESLVRQSAGDVQEYKGIRIATGVRHEAVAETEAPRDVVLNANQPPAVAFLEAGLLAIGSLDSVKSAIDAKTSGQNVTANSELMTYVNGIRSGQSAWAVGRFDAIKKAAELPDQISQHLPAVQWVALTTHFNGGVTGSIRADATDDAAAENLRDVIRGGLAMGRLVSGEDPKLKLLLDSMQMSGTGKTVSLTFSVSSEMVDMLAGLAAMSEMHEKNPGATDAPQAPQAPKTPKTQQ
ncbi:MAG TPA: hypothetical protein VMZ90_07395 [Vicinamibacterales bacterium]|nr:hypothetical protein [Vicinamibacterales bacterium]